MPGDTGHAHSDQNEERAHDNYPHQQNVAWLWQCYQTSANLCRLANFALRRAPSASRPARCGRSQPVVSGVGRFRNSALSVSSLSDLSQRFAKSVLLPAQDAFLKNFEAPSRQHYRPPKGACCRSESYLGVLGRRQRYQTHRPQVRGAPGTVINICRLMWTKRDGPAR